MIGKQISNYTVTAHLGQGGMGNVFKATDNMLGREVALKMLHPQLTVQPQFLERFRKEARILAQLLHPNIAVIYNFFEQDGDHYMVMEYVEGTNVDDLLKQHFRLPASLVIPIAVQALEGLQHAHRKQIFHRDIKPANLMITNDEVVKLMDFGIAKVAGEQKLTQVNKIVGTIEFMAPELIQGKDASAASDIYSMGATMYEMLTGKIPFSADSDYNLMQTIMKSKPVAPDKLNPAIPGKLSEIILKAMDKDPGKRFANAREFQLALMAAFPDFRQLELSLIQSAPTTLETRIFSTDAETRFAGRNTGASSIQQMLADPSRSWGYLKEKIHSKKKWLLLLLAFFVLLLSGYFIFRDKGNKQPDLVENNKPSQGSNADINSQRNPYETPVEGSGDATVPNRQIPPVSVAGEAIDKPSTPGKNGEEKKEGNGRRKSNVSVISGSKLEEENTQGPEKKEPQKPKSIRIPGGTQITLRLASRVDMNQQKKSEQRATFSVVRPVYQNGVLIIREGATATGSITVGRVMTDIKINEVETVTGKRISVKSEKAHGRRADLEEGNHYTAITTSGAEINF